MGDYFLDIQYDIFSVIFGCFFYKAGKISHTDYSRVLRNSHLLGKPQKIVFFSVATKSFF